MCSISGIVSKKPKDSREILIDILRYNEAAGYDNVGSGTVTKEGIVVKKIRGNVAKFESYINPMPSEDFTGQVSIAHTRWATHGDDDQKNAHPHVSYNALFALIHNGKVINYLSLKKLLQKEGIKFKSDTDSEIVVSYIAFLKEKGKLTVEEAVIEAMEYIEGTNSFLIMSTFEPDTLYAIHKGRPVVVGQMDNTDYVVSLSDQALLKYTQHATYLQDNQLAIITAGRNLRVIDLTSKRKISIVISKIEGTLEAISKGKYKDFTLKEIHDQPNAIKDTIAGRVNQNTNTISLKGLVDFKDVFTRVNKIFIFACGTSYHAGLIGETYFEDIAGISTEVKYASEIDSCIKILTSDDLVIVISQSGATHDTITALKKAKEKGATVFGITNTIGSEVSRETHAGVYTLAGFEKGVASTKAFTTQIIVLLMIALEMAWERKKIAKDRYEEIIKAITLLPRAITKVLKTERCIRDTIAPLFAKKSNALYLGTGYGFPVALEGALKLKEITYIHAEGMAAGESKHGYIALVDKNMPVIFIATELRINDKILSNMHEIKARKGIIFAIVSKGDKDIGELAKYIIEIPHIDEVLMPIIATIPLQFIAYYTALLKGLNVDQPRNLAKVVTVD